MTATRAGKLGMSKREAKCGKQAQTLHGFLASNRHSEEKSDLQIVQCLLLRFKPANGT
jgi:hypothetical protein